MVYNIPSNVHTYLLGRKMKPHRFQVCLVMNVGLGGSLFVQTFAPVSSSVFYHAFRNEKCKSRSKGGGGLCFFYATLAFLRFIKPFMPVCNWTPLIYMHEGCIILREAQSAKKKKKRIQHLGWRARYSYHQGQLCTDTVLLMQLQLQNSTSSLLG